MATSSDYYTQMQTYQRLIDEDRKKKGEYSEFLTSIKKLSSVISNVGDNLKECEDNFLSGGYYYGDTTLDSGILNKDYTSLSDANTNLKTIIDYTKDKITTFNNNIFSNTINYNTAKSNYEKALAAENSAK